MKGQDLTYVNENGDQVFTSQFLRNRGTCCKTNCLHCPYGTTLKNLGLEVRRPIKEQFELLQSIVDKYIPKEGGVVASLLNEGFGSKKKSYPAVADQPEMYRAVYLKGQLAAVAIVKLNDPLAVEKVFCAEHFDQQGINETSVAMFIA